MTARLRALLPDGLAARFALLLAAALLAANLVALILLSTERQRIDREANTAREAERIVALVPAMEALAPHRRAALARDASTRVARISVDPAPLLDRSRSDIRSRGLQARLAALLGGNEVRAAILDRSEIMPRFGDRGPQRGPGAITLSIGLAGSQGAPPAWLNIVSTGGRPGGDGVQGRVFLLVLGLSLLAVLGVGLLSVRQLTRPLSDLAAAARAAGQGDRSIRVPERGARETRQAAAAFNDMQAKIARFEAERLRTLAAVGHDLRTPITSLRIRAEMLDEDDGAPMIRTLDEMAVMANGLVAFAQGSQDVEAVARIELVPFLRRLCDERGAQLAETEPLAVMARPVALTRAIGNLVDNALRYGKAARVEVARSGDSAVIRIDDDGPGIDPARLDQMFEPFVRGDDSRSSETGGAGLGLSIARSIIRAHGGDISLRNRTGGGLRATVSLAVAPGTGRGD